jgi:predicted nucleic acid-binding protein
LAHALLDCLQLALSIRLGVPLVTADQRFARRVGTSYAGGELLSAFLAAGH